MLQIFYVPAAQNPTNCAPKNMKSKQLLKQMPAVGLALLYA